MSVRKSFDHRLNDWLDEGPQVAPHDLLHAVLEELPSHRQGRRRLFGWSWRIAMFTLARVGVAAAAVAVVAAVIIATRQAAPVGTHPTPTPQSSSTFTSKFYGYSVSVPPGWKALPAVQRWDGTGAPDIQDFTIDLFESPQRTARAVLLTAAPTSKDLAAYVAAGITTGYLAHRDTCPAAQHPESVESITVGGEPAKLVSMNCGILINTAFTVHDGMGYRFVFRDEGVQAATDPADKATFIAMLASVEFK